MADKKTFLLRISPEIYDALAAWASDDLRSLNGQIEFLLRQALVRSRRNKVRSRPAGQNRDLPPGTQ